MAKPPGEQPRSIHDAYVADGARGYYEQHGADYRNPHEPVIRELIGSVVDRWPLDFSNVLDLAAGSGEITLALSSVLWASSPQAVGKMPTTQVSAIDPFTAAAYKARTGQSCERITFEQIAEGALRGRSYSLIMCSFAMHLADISRLPALCWELAQIAPQLMILTPHKRPILRDEWGWTLHEEILHHRVRARLYLRGTGFQPVSSAS